MILMTFPNITAKKEELVLLEVQKDLIIYPEILGIGLIIIVSLPYQKIIDLTRRLIICILRQ